MIICCGVGVIRLRLVLVVRLMVVGFGFVRMVIRVGCRSVIGILLFEHMDVYKNPSCFIIF